MCAVLLLFFTAGLFAQISVTNATFPIAGDVLELAIDNAPVGIVPFTPPGVDQVWDFSSLQADATQNITYRPASEGSQAANVPGAELFAVRSPGTETYFNVTSTSFEQQAYWGILPYDLVANNLFDYFPPLAERRAPLNFFDISVSSSNFLEVFLPSAFPASLMINLATVMNNAPIDSMRYRVAISSADVVDAYGTVSIPGGTYDVLREKRTQYTETRIDAKIPPLGWLDITDNCLQAGFNGLGVDTTVTFYFHNDVWKEHIAIVTLNNDQDAVTKVVFKANGSSCPTGNTLYVKANATGANDGSSWANAFTDLQDALASTCPGITEIWVAQGTYKPTATTDPAISFAMKNGVTIYGGFPNFGNPGFGDRNPDPTTNGTVLSGNIGNGSSNVDNSYHVINNTGLNATARLDGFTISGGNAGALGLNINAMGGGMLNQSSSPTLKNCRFEDNLASYGGGMFNDGNGSSPVLNDCYFVGNRATFGGGMNNSPIANPSITDCTFSGNQASSGGGLYNAFGSTATINRCRFMSNTAIVAGGLFSNGSLSISNCLFFGNSATGNGGGMNLLNNTTAVINCTFSENSASQGGGVFNENGNPGFTNCIVWSNTGGSIINSGTSPAVTRSIVQGGYAACIECPSSNGDIDPLFVSTTDLRLQACSPAIDAGADGANTAATDLDGNDRTFEAIPGAPTIDMGAYEYQSTLATATYYVDTDGDNYGTGAGQTFCEDPGTGWALQAGDCDDNAPNVNPGSPEICDGIDNNCIDGIDENNICCPPANILYVNDDASGNNDGTSWANAFTDLQSALNSTCSGITQIWVAEGIYTPGTARTDAFVMKNNLAIYGGFPNTGDPVFGDRDVDPSTNNTILSGEIGAAANTDNSYHVIFNNSNGLTNTAVLDGFTVTGGNADGSSSPHYYGGGMYNSNSSPTVTNCAFSGNSARDAGGMYNYSNSSPTVTNCTFSGNYAAFSGSGMYNSSSSPTVSNCTFSGNYANSSGGGMYNNASSSPTVTDCTFSGNTGGGMVNFSSCSPVVSNCTFSVNSASQGGGMYNNSSSMPRVTDCTFSGNSAVNDGGGIFNIYGSAAVITNCTFSGNYATNGGGSYNGNRSYPVYTNCLFLSNGASQTGGAMYNPDFTGGIGSSAIINCTFSGNSAASGSVANNINANLTMTNCILWGNTGGVISNNNNTTNFNNSIVQGGYSPCANCPNGNGDIDPLFVSTTDLRLQECSPAIDAGTSSGAPANDIEGNGRVDAALGNSIVDMGAYEFQGTVPGPTPFCASNLTVQLDANLIATVTAAQIGDSSDGCGELFFLIDGDNSLTFDCDGVGPQTVTLQVTDLFMNVETTTCSFTVADDNNVCCTASSITSAMFSPASVCPGDEVTLSVVGDLGDGTTWVWYEGECPLGAPSPPTIVGTGASITVTPSISTTYFVRAEGGCLVDEVCTQVIVVVDAVAPTAVCQNIDVYLDANGDASIVAADVDGGSTDNCGVSNLTISQEAFTCDDIASNPNPVTLTVFDATGNLSDCVAQVTVRDTISPMLACQNATFALDNNGNFALSLAIASQDIFTAFTDNCAVNTFVVNTTRDVFTCDDLGDNEVMLFAFDVNGNRATCTTTITITDPTSFCNQPPVAVCTSVTVNADANCEAMVAAAAFDGGSTDEDMDMLTFSVSPEGPYALGTNSVTLTVSDGTVSSQCMTTVTVNDTTAPTITCPADVTVACNEDTMPASTGFATSIDNCSTPIVMWNDSFAAACGNTGVITRTWTATDVSGNPSSCNQIITIVDITPPIVSCPADATVECGQSTDPTATGTAIGSDLCGTVAITFSDSTVPGCGNTETIIRTWTATDACGNPSSCTQLVNVVDTTPPVISCPADATVECGGATDPLATGMATGSDVCGSVTITFSDSTTPGCGNTQTIIRTWTATDVCGNTSNCTQLINVVDTTPPVISCPADATVECGGATDPLATGMATGSDVCGSVTITFSDSTTPGCGNTETITRTWTATDACGNPSSCTQLITVVDTAPPVFDLACQADLTFTTEAGDLCPAEAMISLTEGDEITVNDSWTVGGNLVPSLSGCVSDICSAVEDQVITVADITITDEGTCSRNIAVTFIATDPCGNDSAPFVRNYTFLDDTAPVFNENCMVDLTVSLENTDLCPAEVTISLNEGDEITVNDIFTVGGIAVDNLAGCVFDNCKIAAELNITVDDITITDNSSCSRTISVTFIADDGCGNFSEPFTYTYTVFDTKGPQVSFNGIPDGGTYVVECNVADPNWDPLIETTDLTIIDACSAVDFATLTVALTQLYDGPCVNNLLTRWQQVFTVQDVYGNTTVYTLFTEIIDTTPPAFDFSPADVTIECDETAPLPEMEAFDSCSEVVYGFTEVRTDGDCPNNYTLTRTWTATDGCGNASSEVQVVTVEDTTPPVIDFIDGYINQYESGQDVFVECSEYGNISQLIANSAAAFDNCSGRVEVTYQFKDLGNFDCLEYGYAGHLVSTWTSKDDCGNVSVATLNWFLVDETAPVFQGLPEDACASLDNLPPVPNVQAVDDCELAVLTFNQSDPIDCDGGQYIERTWTAEDACGNTNSYTQRISLNGTSGPTITIDYPEIGDVMDGDLIQLPIDCDQDIAFSIEELEAAISVGAGCGSGSSSIELNLMDEGDCTENGYFARYRLSVTATDACGNTTSMSIMIDFVDMTPPVVSSANELTLNCGDDIPMIEATDACGEIASMTFVDSAPIEVSCVANPVAYDRTWTVTDACGNATTFVQSIIVLDNAGPVFSSVPADMCNDTGIDVVVTAIDGCTGNQAQVSFDEVMSSESGCGEVLTRT
ncbi:MAG: hypothetical protein C7N36_10770, partial [Bacteroidetes bacterium]